MGLAWGWGTGWGSEWVYMDRVRCGPGTPWGAIVSIAIVSIAIVSIATLGSMRGMRSLGMSAAVLGASTSPPGGDKEGPERRPMGETVLVRVRVRVRVRGRGRGRGRGRARGRGRGRGRV